MLCVVERVCTTYMYGWIPSTLHEDGSSIKSPIQDLDRKLKLDDEYSYWLPIRQEHPYRCSGSRGCDAAIGRDRREWPLTVYRWPSAENATELTQPSWPSSVCRHAFQSDSTLGFSVIQFGSSFSKSSLIRLRVGLNTSADA
jgi:hypothetical protein